MPSPAGPSGPGGAEVAPKVPWRRIVCCFLVSILEKVGPFQSILVIALYCFLFEISPNLSILILGFNAYLCHVDWGTSEIYFPKYEVSLSVPAWQIVMALVQRPKISSLHNSKALWCAFGCLRSKRSSCKPLVCLLTEPPPPWPASR